jgi:C-terminal processing protease CtpA/Prc
MYKLWRGKKAWAVGAAAVVLGAAGFALWSSQGRGHDGPPQKDMLVSAEQRQQLIESVIANLNRSYVYPDKAAAIEQRLRAALRQGDFAAIDSAEKLAGALTESLQSQTHDKHLEVRYSEQPVPVQASDQDGSAEDKVAEQLREQRLNFGFAEVRRLHGNIGYIDLHQFSRPQHAAERIAAAMTLVGDTKALIIDLRKCGGGDPDTVMQFASYLFDRRTHLNDIYWREENRTEERWTQDSVAGQRYGEARKLYLLTSADTFSACEDFAYALKYAGRATLIGETTGGGAHPGNPRRLSEHFMVFVPQGRAINPVTHTDWEAVGVAPQVKTSAKAALDTAQIAALKGMIAAETDAEWKARLQDCLHDLQ